MLTRLTDASEVSLDAFVAGAGVLCTGVWLATPAGPAAGLVA